MNDNILLIQIYGYKGEAAKEIQSVKFAEMGFTPEEFEEYWAMLCEADMATPWPSDITFEDVFRIFRDLWRPLKPIGDILTELRAVLVSRDWIEQ